MSTLENRIDSLEQKTVEQGAENDALRELLARLQEENERLRSEGGSSISPVDEVLPLNPFDFVPSLDHYDYNQPPAATLPIPAYAQDASTSTPALNVRRAVPFASTATEALLDLSSIMPMVSTNHENFSYLDVAGILSPMTIEAGFNFTYSNDKPSDSLGSIPPTFGSLSPLATGSNFVYPPLRTTGPSEVAAEGSSASSSSGARSARSPSTPPSFIGADYRDVGFAGKDYGFGNGMELGGIAGDDITDFSAFLAGSPAPPTPAATVPSVAPASVAGLPCGGKDGYSFDLDGLCKEYVPSLIVAWLTPSQHGKEGDLSGCSASASPRGDEGGRPRRLGLVPQDFLSACRTGQRDRRGLCVCCTSSKQSTSALHSITLRDSTRCER